MMHNQKNIKLRGKIYFARFPVMHCQVTPWCRLQTTDRSRYG